MSIQEKLDMIDLTIIALKEHEKRLDALYLRFLKAVKRLEKVT